MKRYLSFLAILSIMSILFACGGGGSSDSSSGSSDTSAPSVTAFSVTAPATGLTVQVTAFTATDNTGVTGYLITSSSTAPAASAGWTTTAPTSFTFTAEGPQIAYAWVKDAAGNVSLSRSAAVTLTGVPARQVNGVVTNPVSGAPLGGATVSAFVQLSSLVAKTVAAPVVTVITNADGTYTVTGLTAGVTYYFEITATGFATFTYYNINPDATNNLTLATARVIPSTMAGQTTTASGKVKNASTNVGLPNMTVKIRSGVGSQTDQTGPVLATATTDSTGAYSFAALAAGTYTAEVTGNIGTTPIITSYFTLVSFPGTTLNTNQDFSVTVPLSSAGPGQYRIVLSWGDNPSDLDSHLTGPATATGANATTGTRFHTAYYEHDYPSGSATSSTITIGNNSFSYYTAGALTEAVLDVDNTIHGSDNGPETTTIVVPKTGTYRFYVHHFYGTSTISASGAQVVVYKGNAQLAAFNPPASALGDGAVWSVFTMDVTASGQTITPVNTISMISTGTLPKPAGSGFEDYLLFSNLPRK
ncbi:MAG: carboxypeptidase regulatory-like domain-containing protein [Pelobacteraceae bacterium]